MPPNPTKARKSYLNISSTVNSGFGELEQRLWLTDDSEGATILKCSCCSGDLTLFSNLVMQDHKLLDIFLLFKNNWMDRNEI